MEGSGSYGSGACAHLGAAREQAIEFSHPRTAATSDGAKTDTLDARRAAREVLGRPDPAVPRARGRREALRALETTRPEAPRRRAPLESIRSAVSPTTFCTSTTASAARPATAATTNNHSRAVRDQPPRQPRGEPALEGVVVLQEPAGVRVTRLDPDIESPAPCFPYLLLVPAEDEPLAVELLEELMENPAS